MRRQPSAGTHTIVEGQLDQASVSLAALAALDSTLLPALARIPMPGQPSSGRRPCVPAVRRTLRIHAMLCTLTQKTVGRCCPPVASSTLYCVVTLWMASARRSTLRELTPAIEMRPLRVR